MNDNYQLIINKFTSFLSNFNKYNDIMSIYLSGSVARKEHINNRSDIDIYVVLTQNNEEIINLLNNYLYTLVKENAPKLIENNPEPVSISTTTFEEIINQKTWLGKGIFYNHFQQTSMLLYGQDIRPILRQPTKKEITSEAIELLNYSFELVKNFNIDDLYLVNLEQFSRDVVNLVFKSIYCALLIKNKEVFYREQLIKVSNEVFQIDDIFRFKLLYDKVIKDNFDKQDVYDLINIGKDIIIQLYNNVDMLQ